MSFTLSIESIEDLIKKIKVEDYLDTLHNYQSIIEYIKENERWFKLDKWPLIYIKLVDAGYEYSYGPPVNTFVHLVIDFFPEKLLSNRKLLLKLKKDCKLTLTHFSSLLPEKLRLSLLLKTKKRVHAVETLEGFHYIQDSSKPWSNKEINKLVKNYYFINQPENLQELFNFGLNLNKKIIIATLKCTDPFSFLSLLSFRDNIKQIASILEREINKKKNILNTLREWRLRFNVDLLKELPKDDCLICRENLAILYRHCPYRHYACETCSARLSGRCPFCGFLFS